MSISGHGRAVTLDGVIGGLKRAFIDAYMALEETVTWEPRGDVYEEGSSANTTVSRPNSHGNGGGQRRGDFIFYEDLTFVPVFDEIRARVDQIMEPWLDLPEPSAIEAIAYECAGHASALAANAVSVVPGGQGSGATNSYGMTASEVPGFLRTAESAVSRMSGATINAFAAKYLHAAPEVIQNLHSLALLRLGVAEAERQLWINTRAQLLETVGAVSRKTAALATGQTEAEQVVNQIAGGAVKVLLGTLGGFGDAVKELLSGIEGSEKTETVTITATSFENAFSSLERALKTISDSVKAEESALQTAITRVLNGIQSTQNLYDLVAPDERSMSDAEAISFNEADIATCCTSMRQISEAISAVRTPIWATTLTPAIYRDHSIGLGIGGPQSAFGDLNMMLYSLLGEMADDFEDGAILLNATYQEAMHHEGSTASALAAAQARMEQGVADSPWH